MNFNEHITYCKLLGIKASDDEYLSKKFVILDNIFRDKLSKGTYYISDAYLSHSIIIDEDNYEITINKNIIFGLAIIDTDFFDISETIFEYYFEERFNIQFSVFMVAH
jgi:hypothetical protein